MPDLTKPLLAAMVSDELRIALAEVLIGDIRLTDLQRERALARLAKMGLLQQVDDGYAFDSSWASAALKATSTPRKEGIDRFLTVEGRIDRYPSDAAARVELLDVVARRLLSAESSYSEKELTEKLSTVADDAVLLRRHLVDYQILERTASGDSYWFRARS